MIRQTRLTDTQQTWGEAMQTSVVVFICYIFGEWEVKFGNPPTHTHNFDTLRTAFARSEYHFISTLITIVQDG